MKVRIQLLRDNGNVVMALEGNATSRLLWEARFPLADLITEDGTKISSFDYQPVTSTHHISGDIDAEYLPRFDIDE